MQFVGRLKGELPGLDEGQSEDEQIEEDEVDEARQHKNADGWFSAFRALVGNKKLTAEDIQPAPLHSQFEFLRCFPKNEQPDCCLSRAITAAVTIPQYYGLTGA
ncbi:unnamed protein product [Gongylonema pulchrum]|uniref:Uncharacterized protein n=1 Tax=Gongylonema pulchrum TaxID=637853 RepID=A0A183DF59_9BILA|nr:unnamed protein product [Gongylonema pulchrum]